MKVEKIKKRGFWRENIRILNESMPKFFQFYLFQKEKK